MRPVAFFRHQTDYHNPRFGIGLEEKGEIFLPFYMHLRHTLPDESDPHIPGLTVLRARAPARATLPKEIFVKRVRSSNRKKIDPEMIPDLWTGIGVPIASDRFLRAIVSEVTKIGECVPIRLYDKYTGEPIQKNYYMLFFYCVARLDAKRFDELEALTDYRLMIIQEAESLATVLQNNTISGLLRSRGIWVLYEQPDILFFSPRVMELIRNSELSGFSEFKNNMISGDVFMSGPLLRLPTRKPISHTARPP